MQLFSPFAYQREIYNDDNGDCMDDVGDDIDDSRDDMDDSRDDMDDNIDGTNDITGIRRGWQE